MEINTQPYHVKLQVFEGPLDILLNLIEERKLKIVQVSLAEVTDQFVAYIEKTKIAPGVLAEFLQVAATLIIIKTKALLPFLTFTEEEEEDATSLERRLKLLVQFREAGKNLRKTFRAHQFSFGREELTTFAVTFYPPKNVDTETLYAHFRRIADEFVKFFERQKYARASIQSIVSLEEKIQHIAKLIEQALEKRFHEIILDSKNKMEIVVTFLAMLELIKQKLVAVEQQGLFGEITIRKLT